MRWAKSTKFQTVLVVEDEVFNIKCETDFDDDFALSINGEYIKDVPELPTEDELLECIGQLQELNEMAGSLSLGVEL